MSDFKTYALNSILVDSAGESAPLHAPLLDLRGLHLSRRGRGDRVEEWEDEIQLSLIIYCLDGWMFFWV